MKFAFIDAKQVAFPVAVMCEVLAVARSGYYAWKQRPASAREKQDARLAAKIAAAHARSRETYGSPRIHAELKKDGERVGKKRVERLMREHDIAARRKRRFVRTTDARGTELVAPNLLERDFHRAKPNQCWVGDVTYIETHEGWLYLAVLIDLFSRAVVGWAASAANDTELALAALRAAVARRRPPGGLVHHTDRGSPYGSGPYRAELRRHGMRASMSRTGDCWDNAVSESFFATLKGEHVDHNVYPTHAAAVASIGEYIERFYNCERLHSHIGYLNPIEFELRSHVTSLAA